MWERQLAGVAAAARRQWGLITSTQADRLGCDAETVAHFKQTRLFTLLDWDVYEVAGSSTPYLDAYALAAWLAVVPERFRWERPKEPADDAVVSHESACQVHRIGSIPDPQAVLTVPAAVTPLRAMRTHVARLSPGEVTTVDGVPVTTPHRTLLDLARDWAGAKALGRAIFDAARLDLIDLGGLHADLAPLAEEYGFPADGPAFVEHFMPEFFPTNLSLRNRRAYAALRWPDRVAEVQARLRPAVGDDALSRDVAAEIVARTRTSVTA